MSKTKSMYLTEEIAERFKTYCNNNGLKMGFILDKIVNEWLDKQEEK